EVIAGNDFEIGRRHVARRIRRMTFAIESSLPVAHQRRIRSNPRALNPGKRGHFIEQRLGKNADLLAAGISFPRQLKSRTEKASRFVTKLKRLHFGKAFQNKSSGDQQSQSERDLAN